jgi:hypothetical protein
VEDQFQVIQVNIRAPTKPPARNQGLMMARSMAWKAPTKVRSSVLARPGMMVWA